MDVNHRFAVFVRSATGFRPRSYTVAYFFPLATRKRVREMKGEMTHVNDATLKKTEATHPVYSRVRLSARNPRQVLREDERDFSPLKYRVTAQAFASC